MKVIVETREKVKSRKVNKYVETMLKVMALNRELKELEGLVTLTQGKLTGGQMAEAQKILDA